VATRPAPHLVDVSAADPPAGPHRLDPERAGDHVDRLFRAAWAMSGRREDAEDLVQETYARVLAKPRWVRQGDDLGYLLRVLRNTHISRLRARARRPVEVALDATAEPGAPRGGWDPEAALDARALFEIIAQLPADFRDALVAVDVAGLSYREAGAALRVREATITTRLHRARARVAAELTRAPTLHDDPPSESHA
jgi:RNA polymerase sigma-70 factor (ECF subfamily)